jgi:hypothetical protein
MKKETFDQHAHLPCCWQCTRATAPRSASARTFAAATLRRKLVSATAPTRMDPHVDRPPEHGKRRGSTISRLALLSVSARAGVIVSPREEWQTRSAYRMLRQLGLAITTRSPVFGISSTTTGTSTFFAGASFSKKIANGHGLEGHRLDGVLAGAAADPHACGASGQRRHATAPGPRRCAGGLDWSRPQSASGGLVAA